MIFSALILLGCRPGTPLQELGEIQATVSEQVPTVVTVTFLTAEGLTGATVDFTDDTGWAGRATARATKPGQWQAVLAGLAPDSLVTYTVHAGDQTSDELTVTTGSLGDFATGPLTVSGEISQGIYLVPVSVEGDWHTAAYRSDGVQVWAWAWPDIEDLVITSAQLDPHDDTIWFGAFHTLAGAASEDGTPTIVKVDLAGATTEVEVLPDFHHHFMVLDDGRLAWTEADEQDVEGEAIAGDRLMQRRPGGSTEQLWSSWDSFDFVPGESVVYPANWWTVVNTFDYDPAADAYLVSVNNLYTVVQMSAVDGSEYWKVGQDPSAIQPDDLFTFQHGVDSLGDDRMLVFDNNSASEGSEVQEIQVDRTAGTATTLQRLVPEEKMYSAVMGDSDRLSNGHTLATFATSGTLVEFDDAGAQVGTLEFPRGVIPGFVQVLDGLSR